MYVGVVATELWLRNPTNYVRECVEVNALDIIWDQGLLRKKGIDPNRFMDLYYGTRPWRSIVLREQGAYLIDSTHTRENPLAVFPVWVYGERLEILRDYIENPVGDSFAKCHDPKVPIDERPVFGQEHRVLIALPPNAQFDEGVKFLKFITELQADNPECKIHPHGYYSFRMIFANHFGAVDWEARSLAAQGKVMLPNGRQVTARTATLYHHWVKLLGFQPVDLKVPRNRCIFNILSAMWAAKHYADIDRFAISGAPIDPDEPGDKQPTNNRIQLRNLHRRPAEGDKFLCNVCTLQLSCKFFRRGAVCIVPESEPVELAKFFKTRDSGVIIEGLGTLLAAQTHRLERALEQEEASGKLSDDTTKIINTLFDRGVKLAKLVDPALAAAGAPRISLTQNTAHITAGTPQELMAQIVESFTAQGIPRDKITPEMVMNVMEHRNKAIEATAKEA